MDACLAGGVFTFEENFLPVIQNVYQNPELDGLCASFSAVTDGLEERIQRQFGQGLDADLTLYLGLCHGAGWVVKLAGRDVVLLGIEKILELNWQSREAMTGLVYHELGHVYHRRHGALDQGAEDGPEGFVWQLFTEGVAMCFEQDLVGDSRWFHQDSSGWLAWCEAHFSEILADFDGELPKMVLLYFAYRSAITTAGGMWAITLGPGLCAACWSGFRSKRSSPFRRSVCAPCTGNLPDSMRGLEPY